MVLHSWDISSALVFFLLLNFCAGAYQEQPCANRGGTCMHGNSCGESALRGLCPKQPGSVLCCVSSSNQRSSGAYQEQPCANRGGTCMHSSSCGGSALRGLCPTQPSSVLCCVSGGSSSSASSSGNNCGCSYEYASRATKGPAPGAEALARYMISRFGGKMNGIYVARNVRGSSVLSLHAEGRAVDITVSGQAGWNAFHHAISIACRNGIQEVIFSRKIWTNARGIRHYSGPNPHTDHIHIGLNRCGARNFNL